MWRPLRSMRQVSPGTTVKTFQSRPPRLSYSTTNPNTKESADEKTKSSAKPSEETQPAKKKKTQAELDKELELKMQGLAGDGGESGVELEDGQPVSMKRSVKNNMFRYI